MKESSRRMDGSSPYSHTILFCLSRQSCKFRVRWKPRAECLCAPNTSATNSSSSRSHPNYNYARPQRPMYELNGVPVYLNNTGHNSTNGAPRSLLCLTNKDARRLNGYTSNAVPCNRDNGGSKRKLDSSKACNKHRTWRNSCGGLNVTEELALFPLTNTNVFEDHSKTLMLPPIPDSLPGTTNGIKRPAQITNDLEKNSAPCCTTCYCEVPNLGCLPEAKEDN